ncbi:carboxypeptidase regulatory-like domain-containing protein [bacterium SCSIO 12741]|nr:carboxypeptidase regulatory-like domain-containing protein [bacterium SCSIO 12741]
MKYLISILTLTSFMLASTLLQATGSIKGKVFDPDGLPVISAHAYVKVGANIYGSQTDIDGRFTIKPLPTGTYTLIVTFSGFDTVKVQEVEVLSGRITIMKDIHMNYRTLGVFDMVYYKDLIIIDEPSVQTIDAEFIDRLPYKGGNMLELVSAISSEVSQPEPGGDVYIRGSRSGSVVYFVDGVKTFDGNQGIPGAAIGNMRVYTGGVPAMYGDCLGGVIVVESKSYFGSGR